MILYKKDGRGNAILQRLDGKLLCNVISIRRLKPAYIKTANGDTLTKKEHILAELKKKPDAFTTEMEKGLLPEYLQFEDADGNIHSNTDTLMVMYDPTNSLEYTPDMLNSFQGEPLKDNPYTTRGKNRQRQLKHLQQGEYEIVKGRFKNGTLQFLLKRINGNLDQSIYVNCTENLECLNMMSEEIYTKLRITGNPNIPFKTENLHI